MSEDILVVEYEPRYTERVKHALSGQSVAPIFARDGDEALRALERTNPRLIVLSSVIPKIATADLIRTIRGRHESATTPILLTVSGYNGKNPQADATRVGANDILAKPYTEADLLGKVGELLGVTFNAPVVPISAKLTSDEIFGDLVDEQPKQPEQTKKAAAAATAATAAKHSSDELDKLLAHTLSGVMPQRKKTLDGVKTPDAAAKQSGVDKLVQDTLSGLEKNLRNRPADAGRAAPAAVPEAAASSPAPVTPAEAPVPDPIPFPSQDRSDGTMSVAAPLVFPKQDREEPREETSPDRFGQYVLSEKIATGGMAEVWKAQMRGVEGFQKTVAIKKILPHLSDNEDFVTMFIDEAKLAAQLNHNNIIHIYDLGKIGSSYFIAMEYIDGHDLKSILRVGEERGLPMTVELAVFVASKIAAALDYAHRKRDFNEQQMELVHRDVSPQNILISYDGDIKLCDFGIAKAASKASHTQAGALKGKLQYMSPEQAWGRPLDRRSDIFALGSVLFELLTGRKMFTGDNDISVLDQVREAKFVAPSEINDEVPAEIDAIVRRALSREPEQRYQTAGEMARDLDGVLYSFRPTPSSADLAIYMHRLYSDEPMPVIAPTPAHVESKPAPRTQSFTNPIDDLALLTPAAVSASSRSIEPAAPVATAVPFGQPVDDRPKRSVLPLAIGAVVLLAAVGAGAFVYFRNKPAAPATQTAAATPAAPVATASVAPLADTTVTSTTAAIPAAGAPVAGAGAAVDDRALIDAEVRKRIAAERARLEQQRAQSAAPQQQAAQRAAEPPPRETQREPAATEPAPQTAAATPATQTSAPAPVQEARTETAAPAPAQPAAARTGDLVQPGTPGLVDPQMVNFRKPAYPPIAKMRKVEGIVVLSALISEEGRVLDVRVLRGVSQNVGINEAARDAVRASTFRPGTKDGVRVKAYKTITVPFKL